MKIETTKSQRAKLLQCPPGVGFLAYKRDDETIIETGFWIGWKGTLHRWHYASPLQLEFVDPDGAQQTTPPLGLIPREISEALDCLQRGLAKPIGSQAASNDYHRAAILLKNLLDRGGNSDETV